MTLNLIFSDLLILVPRGRAPFGQQVLIEGEHSTENSENRGGCRGVRTPSSLEITCGFLKQLVFCQKNMWFRPVISQLRHSLVLHPLLKESWIRPWRSQIENQTSHKDQSQGPVAFYST